MPLPSRPVLSIVIPAFNEAKRLGPTVQAALAWLTACDRAGEILVVDDGSTDATSAAAHAAGDGDPRLRVIRLPDNRGKGYAVRVGVANAAGRRVAFTDADGAAPLPELGRLEAALDGGADIAIGSRVVPGVDTVVTARTTRRITGRAFHRVARYAGVRGISDTQCGCKLFTAAAAADLFPRLRLTGYAFDVELLLAAQRRDYRIAEVPVNWSHRDGSQVRVLRDGLRMALDVIRIRTYSVGDACRLALASPAPAGAS
jgi:dolichyl-phosphate beta-glucosyltransferase